MGTHESLETLRWIPVTAFLPDSDITVLCWCEPMGEWFSGFWDSFEWLDAAHGGPLDNVTHWAEPGGPNVGIEPRYSVGSNNWLGVLDRLANSDG